MSFSTVSSIHFQAHSQLQTPSSCHVQHFLPIQRHSGLFHYPEKEALWPQYCQYQEPNGDEIHKTHFKIGSVRIEHHLAYTISPITPVMQAESGGSRTFSVYICSIHQRRSQIHSRAKTDSLIFTTPKPIAQGVLPYSRLGMHLVGVVLVVACKESVSGLSNCGFGIYNSRRWK